MLAEYFREFDYQAGLAKLTSSSELRPERFALKWSGFNETLTTYVAESMRRLEMMKEADLQLIFNQAKEKLMLSWKNFYLEQSSRQAAQILAQTLPSLNFEQKHLRSLLEPFEYVDFQEFHKDWLKSGKCIWFISGNLTSEQAVSLVESAMQQLNLAPLAEEDITDSRIIAFEDNTCLTLEVPLEDDANDNSAVLAYYECGHLSLKEDLCNRIVMQFIEEPFFDDLRTKQQLGYAVHSYFMTTQGITGNGLAVQSPHKSCEYLIGAINKFLVETREKVAAMTDEQFETNRKSVVT